MGIRTVGIRQLGVQKPKQGSSQSWSSYWEQRYPSGITLLIVNATRIDLSWTNNGVQDFDGISIERSTDGVSFVVITTTLPNVATYSNEGLTADTHYYYKIRYYKGSNFSAYSSTVDVDISFMTGILNQFRFDEDSGSAVDDISANNGTVTGAIQGVTGKIDKAISFDGASHDNVVLSSTHTFLTTDSITIAFWVKFTAFAAERQIIDRSTSINSLLQIYYSGNITFRIRGSNAAGITSIVYTEGVTRLNTWYHIICERNVTTDKINIWLNGIPFITEVTDATTANIGPLTIKIGDTQNNVAPFAGVIDELRIYKRVLSDSEKAALYGYRNSESARFDNGKLVLSFDDASSTFYTHGFPVFVNKGVKGVFYIATDLVTGVPGTTISWAQALEMQNAGMGMESHGKTHVNFTTLTQEQVIAEVVNSKADFVANGLVPPNHLAYPFGASNDNVRSWIAPYINTGRVAVGGTFWNNYRDVDKYDLRVRGMEFLTTDAVKLATTKAEMDNAMYYKAAVIYYAHGITDAGGDGAIAVSMLEEIIDYAATIGMDVVTIDELYQQMI